MSRTSRQGRRAEDTHHCTQERESAGPPDRVELIGAGSLGYAYGTGPSFG